MAAIGPPQQTPVPMRSSAALAAPPGTTTTTGSSSKPSSSSRPRNSSSRSPLRQRQHRHLLLIAAALLIGSPICAAVQGAAAAPADAWLELQRFSGARIGAVRGGAWHTGGARARRLREAAYVLDGSTSVGYYTAPMQLGSPPKTFHLILDSGSSLTVVPCKSCDCGYHQVCAWGRSGGGAGGS